MPLLVPMTIDQHNLDALLNGNATMTNPRLLLIAGQANAGYALARWTEDPAAAVEALEAADAYLELAEERFEELGYSDRSRLRILRAEVFAAVGEVERTRTLIGGLRYNPVYASYAGKLLSDALWRQGAARRPHGEAGPPLLTDDERLEWVEAKRSHYELGGSGNAPQIVAELAIVAPQDAMAVCFAEVERSQDALREQGDLSAALTAEKLVALAGDMMAGSSEFDEDQRAALYVESALRLQQLSAGLASFGREVIDPPLRLATMILDHARATVSPEALDAAARRVDEPLPLLRQSLATSTSLGRVLAEVVPSGSTDLDDLEARLMREVLQPHLVSRAEALSDPEPGEDLSDQQRSNLIAIEERLRTYGQALDGQLLDALLEHVDDMPLERALRFRNAAERLLLETGGEGPPQAAVVLLRCACAERAVAAGEQIASLAAGSTVLGRHLRDAEIEVLRVADEEGIEVEDLYQGYLAERFDDAVRNGRDDLSLVAAELTERFGELNDEGAPEPRWEVRLHRAHLAAFDRTGRTGPERDQVRAALASALIRAKLQPSREAVDVPTEELDAETVCDAAMDVIDGVGYGEVDLEAAGLGEVVAYVAERCRADGVDPARYDEVRDAVTQLALDLAAMAKEADPEADPQDEILGDYVQRLEEIDDIEGAVAALRTMYRPDTESSRPSGLISLSAGSHHAMWRHHAEAVGAVAAFTALIEQEEFDPDVAIALAGQIGALADHLPARAPESADVLEAGELADGTDATEQDDVRADLARFQRGGARTALSSLTPAPRGRRQSRLPLVPQQPGDGFTGGQSGAPGLSMGTQQPMNPRRGMGSPGSTPPGGMQL